MAEGKKNCLFWGVGCGLIFILVIGVLGVLGFMKFKEFKEQIEEDERNPVPRAQRILGFTELPPGYSVEKAFAIPMIMDIVILEGDRFIETENPQSGRRGFMYMMFVFGGRHDQELRDFFEGKTDDPRVLRRNHINIDLDEGEILSRSVFEHNGQEFLQMTTRGEVGGQELVGSNGLTSFLLISCPDKKSRFCKWFGPDPDPDATADEIDLTGSVGDPERIKAFIDHFNFCDPRTDEDKDE